MSTQDKGGRPSKLTKQFLDVAEEVIEDGLNVIILTDEELLVKINAKLVTKYPLQPELTVSERTFIRWKTKWKACDTEEQFIALEEAEEKGETTMNHKNFLEFCHLIKKAMIDQKTALFASMLKDDKWQRYAWIIERKFESWNLKQVSENWNRYGDGDDAGSAVVIHLPSNGRGDSSMDKTGSKSVKSE